MGDIFPVLEPSGRFVLPPSGEGDSFDLVLIGAGSGITPLYSLIKENLATHSMGKILLIYASRNQALSLFADSLRTLATQFSSRFKLIEIHSQPDDQWDGLIGRLNNGRLQYIIENQVAFNMERIRAFICGPHSFMRTADITLRFIGVRKENIRWEHFVVESILLSKPTPLTQTIQIGYRGAMQPVLVRSGQSILEAGIAAGLPLLYSCKNGSCGICAVRLRMGAVKMTYNQVLTDRDVKDGWVLTCCGFPEKGPLILDLV